MSFSVTENESGYSWNLIGALLFSFVVLLSSYFSRGSSVIPDDALDGICQSRWNHVKPGLVFGNLTSTLVVQRFLKGRESVEGVGWVFDGERHQKVQAQLSKSQATFRDLQLDLIGGVKMLQNYEVDVMRTEFLNWFGEQVENCQHAECEEAEMMAGVIEKWWT